MGLRLLLGLSRLFGRLMGLRLRLLLRFYLLDRLVGRLVGLCLLLGLRLLEPQPKSRLVGLRLCRLTRAFESLLSKMRWSSRTDSASSRLASLRLSHWSLASAPVSTGFRISHSARCRSPSSSVMGRWRVASGLLTTAKLLIFIQIKNRLKGHRTRPFDKHLQDRVELPLRRLRLSNVRGLVASHCQAFGRLLGRAIFIF